MDLSKIPSPFYRVSLKLLILDHQNRLLMCESPDGEWEPPGGGWEHDESIEECLNRELVEELGVKIKSLGPVVALYRGTNKRGFQALKIALKASLESYDFDYHDMVNSKFVSKEELLTLNMSTDERGLKDQTDKIWPAS